MDTKKVSLTDKCQRYIDIIRYWHLVEFFVPFDLTAACTYSKANYLNIDHAQLQSAQANNFLPWLSPAAISRAAADPQLQYQYTLYLLPFDKSILSKLSAQQFPMDYPPVTNIDVEQRFDDEGLTCFAKLPLGLQGQFDFSRLSLSTLPWAIGHLANGELGQLTLNSYQKQLQKLTIALAELAAHVDSMASTVISDKPAEGILSASSLSALLLILKKWAGFEPDYPLQCVIELRQRPKKPAPRIADNAKQPTDTGKSTALVETITEKEKPPPKKNKLSYGILNSFYLDDLEKTLRYLHRHSHAGLEAYLQRQSATPPIDLYATANQSIITDKLALKKIGQGRWLSDKNQMMSLMQQLAINQSVQRKNHETIFSVNGPPGTGKTTLLQEIIAQNVTARARVLTGFANVAKSFSQKHDIVYPDESSITIDRLHPDLTGYEILVASSNNAAVENISKDLPLLHKLGNAHQKNCRYFAPVAAKIAAEHKDFAVQPLADNKQPWGLISIALGNARNRNQFIDRAFWGPESRENTQPRVQKGDYLTIWEWRRTYQGASFAEAKKAFITADKAVSDYLAKLRRLQQLQQQLAEQTNDDWQIKRQKIIEELAAIKPQLDAMVAQQEILDTDQARLLQLQQQHEKFSAAPISSELTEQWQTVVSAQQQLIADKQQLSKRQQRLQKQQQYIEQKYNQQVTAQQAALTEHQQLQQQLPGLILPPNDASLMSETAQKQAFWQSPELNQLRSELFMAGLVLHEAWLAEALNSGYFIKNIIAITRLLRNQRPLHDSDEKHLWQSLFLWIPVVSSTFASIGRQFSKLPAKSLGYLLIDEGGQAIPQAAVGAILRAKQTVVVGDPQQIEPVFTVPINLIEGLARHRLKTDYVAYLPSQASIQQLADAANPLGATITTQMGQQWIGCPLRIHRRCIEPMFSLANQIAYENKMINARQPLPATAQQYPLGQSCWFDCAGNAQDKHYVPEQGQRLLELLATLYNAQGALPTLYIITPFRQVKRHLQTLISNNENWRQLLRPELALPETYLLRRWCWQFIGTVHTFQGKESDTVIFILGADRQQQAAVNWVSSKPNLINVALTRAKDRIYIIGDYDLWRGRRYFNQLARVLPRVKK